MIFLYRLLYLPGLLLVLPYYLYRMWRRGGYSRGFGNRFGRMRGVPDKRPGVQRVWIQAVSVGELLAIAPLIKSMLEDPRLELILTTTTSTGFRLLEERYADAVAWYGIFPMDFCLFSQRAWSKLEPDLIVLMEGELWPEHIHQAHVRGIPSLLINARLSNRSFRRHLRVKSITRPFFNKLGAIYAGSETDLMRYRALKWLPRNKIIQMGNLKLDIQMDSVLDDQARSAYFREMGFTARDNDDRSPFLLLGSATWPDEEAALVEAYLKLRGEFPDLRLLIVPRHAERKREIETRLSAYPITCHFRSDQKQAPDGTQVYIADTTGELRTLTQLADLVFIGKSLPPNSGGQTPVEAAASGKPIILGPDMSNFRDITRQLVKLKAAVKVEDGHALVPVLKELMENPGRRQRMGAAAAAAIETSRGSTARACEAIRNALSR